MKASSLVQILEERNRLQEELGRERDKRLDLQTELGKVSQELQDIKYEQKKAFTSRYFSSLSLAT